MKHTTRLGVALLFCLAAAAVSARESQPALRYHFSLGQTNVYHVEVTVRGESGLATTSGNIFIVPLEAGSNGFRLSCRGSLNVKNEYERSDAPPYFGGGGSWQNGTSLPDNTEIQLTTDGRLLRVSGDYPLPLPVGTLLTALFPALPSASAGKSPETFIVDSPYWLGPSLFIAAGQQSYGPPFFMNYGPRQSPAALGVSNLVTWKTIATTPTNITLRRTLQLESFLRNGTEPRAVATGAGELVFDPKAGVFRRIDAEYTVSGNTQKASRRVKVAFSGRLVEGDDLAKLLNPPVPPPSPDQKLTAEEMSRLTADLQSTNTETCNNAVNRLRNAKLDSASPELLTAVSALSDNYYDPSRRQMVVNFLSAYGTRAEVPTLIKFLKDADDNNCDTAVKALGRLRDERAIVPLVNLLAGGIRLNQYNQPNNQLLPDIVDALTDIGPAAEKPVLELLQERGIESRRQACVILKQIGTPASIEALQKTVAATDATAQLSQAAADAIRTIQSRQ